MPLRNHFRPPVSKRASWEELHGGWPMVIVQQLRQVLPDRYVAAPRVHLGAQFEVDVAALDRQESDRTPSHYQATERAAWSPAAPSLAVETELADFDEYEVRVYDAERERCLVAAIEIISPGNKDRHENRWQFTSKCAALLRQGISVVLVDLVTSRDFNLYAELLELIRQQDRTLGDDPPATYAVACRWQPRGVKRWLETWSRPLSVGEPLPVLPLWLTEDLSIPLDLEASYEQTCRDLRIT